MKCLSEAVNPEILNMSKFEAFYLHSQKKKGGVTCNLLILFFPRK